MRISYCSSDVCSSELPVVPGDCTSVWHLYTIRHPHRDAMMQSLAAAGIQTLIHYPAPPHLQPAYAALGYAAGAFPVAEAIARTTLSLPKIGRASCRERVCQYV